MSNYCNLHSVANEIPKHSPVQLTKSAYLAGVEYSVMSFDATSTGHIKTLHTRDISMVFII